MGHVSEIMTNHYSVAGADEKKKAVAAVVQLVRAPASGPSGGPSSTAPEERERKAK
jgi:hypothetical protein